jgi:hypothetical protein
LGRFEEARAGLEAVLEQRASFDPDHRDVVRVRFALAQLAGDIDGPEAAVAQLGPLLEQTEARLTARHPASLRIRTALARWTGRAGRIPEAVDMLEAGVGIGREILEQPHRFTLDALQEQAWWKGEQGQTGAAVAQL